MSMVMVGSGVELATAGALGAPGVRVRGRWRSLMLVVLSVFLTGSMGLVVAAPPAAAYVQFAIPVVKGVASIVATTVASEVVLTRNEQGGDKPKGKWGSKLKGLPGLAAGLLGGAVGWLGLGDMIDGVKAPDDFKNDVLTGPTGSTTAGGGTWETWRITAVHWDVVHQATPAAPVSIRFEAENTYCNKTYVTTCPPNPASKSMGGLETQFECGDGTTIRRNLVLNIPSAQSGNAPCTTASGVYLGIRSAEIVRTPGDIGRRGLANPGEKYNNPNFVAGGGEPMVTVTAEATCRVPGTGDVVKASQTVKGVDVIPTVRCPEGTVPESIDWTSNVGGVTEDLGGVGTDWAPFPECAGFKCEKLITIDDQPCRVGIAECYDWQNVQPPSRVKCEYGPYARGLAECGDLAHVYKTTHGVTQDPRPEHERVPGWLPSKPDGTVDWAKVGTEFSPDDNPNKDYRPPARWPSTPTNPDPTPNPTPTAPAGPPTSGSNPPVAGNPSDLDTGKSCIAAAWSLNPVDWVFIPMKCALTWAFVPKPSAAAALTNSATRIINAVGLGEWLEVPASLRESIPVGEGCEGPRLALPQSMGGGVFYPLNACQHPLSMAAEMTRAMSSLVLVVAGVYSIMNSLSLALTGYRLVESTTKDVDK